MIDQKYIDLINQELDGTNTQKESILLRECLSNDTIVQKLFNDLKKSFSVLEKIPQVDPSQNLKKLIMNSIPVSKPQSNERRGFLQALRPNRQFGMKLRYAYVFSLGVIAGAVVLILLNPNISGNVMSLESEILGSVIPHGKPLDFQISDNFDVSLEQLQGTIQIKRSGAIILAKLNIESQFPVEVIFEFDGNYINFNGYNLSDMEETNLNISRDFVRLHGIKHNKGVMIFKDQGNSGQPMKFKILSSEETLYEREVSTGVSG